MNVDKVEEALSSMKNGKFVIVVDDDNRENEGDLIIAAEKATTQSIAFMVRHTSGLICVAMEGNRLDHLDIPLMVKNNTESQNTAFTISVDYKEGTSTGISASDRAATIRALTDTKIHSKKFNRPGHIFPLRSKEGGVLKRSGHTESAIDLTKLAGLHPAGALCEIVNEDGSMARKPQLEEFAKKHQLVIISIADLIRYRLKNEKLVKRISQARIPTPYGEFTAYAYESSLDGIEHLAFVKGKIKNQKDLLVRVHSECITGDIFSSLRCDCGKQLHLAMKKIAEHKKGVLVYLRGQEGRGIGLAHKLNAYTLQDKGWDTVEANLELGLPIDSREYGIGAQILMDLGVSTMRIMTNNPQKYGGLKGYGLEIIERVPITPPIHEESKRYLLTKKEKLGHLYN